MKKIVATVGVLSVAGLLATACSASTSSSHPAAPKFTASQLAFLRDLDADASKLGIQIVGASAATKVKYGEEVCSGLGSGESAVQQVNTFTNATVGKAHVQAAVQALCPEYAAKLGALTPKPKPKATTPLPPSPTPSPASAPTSAPAPAQTSSAWCTARAQYNSQYHDYDVYVNSNQPNQSVVATASNGESQSYQTDSNGFADVYLYADPGNTVTVTVGAASCSTTAG